MDTGLQGLSEREKETLRLLLAGHDAKSSARELGLSVHTVNERLRDARRKLGVSSSREAARILGDAEGSAPNSLGDKHLGVAAAAAPGRDWRQGAGFPLVWLAGGMLVMSLIIAAVVLSSALQGSGAAPTGAAQTHVSGATRTVPETAASAAAREWVALTDRAQWEESWRAAGALFRSQLTASAWAASASPVREPLGAPGARALQNTTPATSLPGLPEGEYEMVEFRTDFARKSGAVETVVMARESGGWKVIGYFIR
jgi:DNA-binding CsgD family transcriptional regulator